MGEDLERLKRRFPLLEYLQGHHWTGRSVGNGAEFVGLCPLHQETRPSFYVNPIKNLFYCHGCGQGGDLIRFVELSRHLSFRQSISYLREQLAPAARLLEHAAAFYQLQLSRHPEAVQYLLQRGLRDPGVIEELGIGYAVNGKLRPHLRDLGYSLDLLLETGLIGPQGNDAFSRRVIFPCRDNGRIVNLYGRSIGRAFPHRLLPRSKGGLFAWESLRHSTEVILVEGFFDLATLWQAGVRNTTCAIGTHPTPLQWDQLRDSTQRTVYIAFDNDANQAGQHAARELAQRLLLAGLTARIVHLPPGQDPNSFFLAGASRSDFLRCLKESQAP